MYPCQWHLDFLVTQLSEATTYISKDFWAAIDELLQRKRETSNWHNPFAEAILKDGVTVGHMP